MSDKDVTRNVRGSGQDGIRTAAEKHEHSLSEHDNLTYGGNVASHSAERQSLLDRFKERELKRRTPTSKEGAPQPHEEEAVAAEPAGSGADATHPEGEAP